MIRSILVDNHILLREGIKKIIQASDDLSISFEASNLNEIRNILETVPLSEWDVMIVGVHATNSDSLKILDELKNQNIQKPIIALVQSIDEKTIEPVMRKGVMGCLTMSSDSLSLIEGIRSVHIGKKYFSPDLSDLFVSNWSNVPEKCSHKNLSQREIQVLVGLLEGRQNYQIAKELGISDKTVSSYKARIFEKLAIQNNAELFNYAIKMDLLSKLRHH